jgi:enoyl-CoA hydratase
MTAPNALKWTLGELPSLAAGLPEVMDALAIQRDHYGPPERSLRLVELPRPRCHPEDGARVLVAVLATGPNFNTNFACLGLPVPVFGKGDPAALHVPGSDALGIVVDAGAAVKSLKVGQAVILDSWTSRGAIRGYETHDGFNAQFAMVDEERALPVPDALRSGSPEQWAALLLTFGTAYRAVVERLGTKPGDAVLLMGGGKGTSFAGAQLAKALGARVILMGSNPELGQALMARGMADAFIDRRTLASEVFGVIPEDLDAETWRRRTEPFRQAVREANGGRLVDGIFEHTGGRNFPLLVSALADGGRLAFFGATGGGVKGEYKETFFYGDRRLVLDARWVWMRQKQILFRDRTPGEIFAEIGLPPGRRGLIWGADAYALGFARAALERHAQLCFIVSRSTEQAGLAELARMGIPDSSVIDRDRLALPADMPDPLTEDGRPNPAYGDLFMKPARALGGAIWAIFGPRLSPDFIVERFDQSTLHFSTFLLRDFDDRDAMPTGCVIAQGPLNRSILGSHMYRSAQARDVLRLLDRGLLTMEPGDLDIVGLQALPSLQQKMLDGTMARPKGVALVQADAAGRSIADCESRFLGECLLRADPGAGSHLDLHLADGIGILTLSRPEALNALNGDLLRNLTDVVGDLRDHGGVRGRAIRALVIRGAGRAFVAGADVTEFIGADAGRVRDIALGFIGLFSALEDLAIPVVALIDGFALGGGNELAMSAHYRVATENAAIGQPEIKLGIFPGYGGMQRLPRLVGPRKALEMTVNGEAVAAWEALAMGLVDAVAPSSTALANAFQAAKAFAEGQRPTPRRHWDALGAGQRGELQALLAEAGVRELASAAPPLEAKDLKAARAFAASYAIKALQFGHAAGFQEGLRNDAELFGEAVASPSGQEWIRRFVAKDPAQSSFLPLFNGGRS